ncbi:TerB family tellurite resistance protein [Roseovarius atlanticus]|uniref:tellurite resistance TerB family protein n=1 Tax=Roseovarius atlanticus TaxID=1641875 RepID=UPI001C95DF57|nr:TerB family tellurite resistance protein [Roseovarius atlanticus]MBY5989295.1 TerB family tellurite resistance protein [Roseovarius atlanticus]MBY6124687.1 TerB family tellurite resistance protein [Roseovarius atlanticus]MBY6149182.1 TerB family tellurite resistance protein [Roseovarius atlanticus]
MFAEFLKKLTESTPETLPHEDARLALTALLVRIAKSDGHFDTDERQRILAIARTRYQLSEPDASALLNEAEQLEGEAPDTVRFTRAIKDAVAYEDRVRVIEALWQVALADGERDASEDAIIRMASNFLGVTDMDSALARQRQEEG